MGRAPGGWREQLPARSGHLHALGGFPHPPANPHLEDDSRDRQVQGLPRHWGRPLVNLIAHCGHTSSVSSLPHVEAACQSHWVLQLDSETSLAGLMVTHLLLGRALACQSTRGRSGSAAPGTAGRRAGGTPAPETAGPTGPVRGHPATQESAATLEAWLIQSPPRAMRSTNSM